MKQQFKKNLITERAGSSGKMLNCLVAVDAVAEQGKFNKFEVFNDMITKQDKMS